MRSHKFRFRPENLWTIQSLHENWEGGGNKNNMWVTLLRIYGAHMTRNITANTTTNTQTLVIVLAKKKNPE